MRSFKFVPADSLVPSLEQPIITLIQKIIAAFEFLLQHKTVRLRIVSQIQQPVILLLQLLNGVGSHIRRLVFLEIQETRFQFLRLNLLLLVVIMIIGFLLVFGLIVVIFSGQLLDIEFAVGIGVLGR